jgi:hypothetical protein
MSEMGQFYKVAGVLNRMKAHIEQVLWEGMKEISEILGIEFEEGGVPSMFKLLERARAEPEVEELTEEYLEELKEREPEPEPIDLKHLQNGLTKFKTEKGWYIKCFLGDGDPDLDDDKEYQQERVKEQNDLNAWLCSIRTQEQRDSNESFGLLMWIQALPKRISKRSDSDRDRSYPSSKKTGVYVNDSEMEYIEQIAHAQEVPVHEKEFGRND